MKQSLTLLTVCLLGIIPCVNLVIDWAIWGPIIAGGVTAGASMTQSALGAGAGFSVVINMEIENWSKYMLSQVEAKPHGGIIQQAPALIRPGRKELMVAHKTANTATGTYGVTSWLIAGKNRRFVVMWSAPYNFNHHSNWLAVGLTETGITAFSNDWFDQMYDKGNSTGLKFIRKEYYHSVSAIFFDDSDFQIEASMGTSHKPKIHIVFRPKNMEDIAPSLKKTMRKRLLVWDQYPDFLKVYSEYYRNDNNKN